MLVEAKQETGVRTAVPFMLSPESEYEHQHGKPVLLTDCEIAAVLDALQGYTPRTDEGQQALNALWHKLMALWDTMAPYES